MAKDIMAKDKYLPDKIPMFVDCKVVGRSRFYKDGTMKDPPKFSKKWRVDTKGTC